MQHESILKSRLTIAHIAMAKGWINGLDLASMAQRYLPTLGDDDGNIDMRVAKSSLTRVLADLAGAAHRNQIKGGNVLSRQAGRIRIDASGPSLEDFQATLEYGDDIGESELVELYKERYAESNAKSAQSMARKSRLVARQLRLLALLEPLVSSPITWQDEVHGWFTPSLAERLDQAGLKTIMDLAIAVASNPTGWFAAAPGVGSAKAARIERFLIAQMGSIEDALNQKGVSFKLPDVEALEQDRGLQLSTLLSTVGLLPSPSSTPQQPTIKNSQLDGSQGRLRDFSTPSAIEASNDYEAMQTWLKLKESAATVRLYEREVTRLIAWSIQVQGRPMSSLSLEDALAYRDFLGSIPADILTKKGPKKLSSVQRKARQDSQAIHVGGFTQLSLTTSSIKKALVIINGFYNWLVAVRYVSVNPFAGVKATSVLPGVGQGSTSADDVESLEFARSRKESIFERALPVESTAAIESYLENPHEDKDAEFFARASFIFNFTIMTGMRISEVASARRDHLEYLEPDPASGTGGGWILNVVGKRNKAREVPIPDSLINHLQVYLAHRGLITLPCPTLSTPPGTFLVGGFPSQLRKNDKQIGDGVLPITIHRTIKELFLLATNSRKFKDPKASEKLQRASTHWMRHTAATRAVAKGVPLDVMASILGHASISTTSRYVRAERDRKLAEMQKLWANPDKDS